MAKKNESSLIGYDPLAWMTKEAVEQAPIDDQAPQMESKSAVIVEGLEVAGEISSKIILEATQTIQNVAQLHEQLCQVVISTPDAIEIDASDVKVCDTATLQLFVILKQEMLRLNRELSFDFPSDRFLEAARLLGVSELLGLDKSVSGFF